MARLPLPEGVSHRLAGGLPLQFSHGSFNWLMDNAPPGHTYKTDGFERFAANLKDKGVLKAFQRLGLLHPSHMKRAIALSHSAYLKLLLEHSESFPTEDLPACWAAIQSWGPPGSDQVRFGPTAAEKVRFPAPSEAEA